MLYNTALYKLNVDNDNDRPCISTAVLTADNCGTGGSDQ